MSSLARGQHALWNSSRRVQFHQSLPLKPYAKLFSTSATRAAKPVPSNQPSQTTVSTPEAHEINAPLSTLPANIDIPAPLDPAAPASYKIKRTIAVGRAYLTFYKTGLKNVFRNYRASLPLRATLGLPAYLPVSPPRKISSPTEPSNNAPQAPGKQAIGLGRGQFQLVRRAARDVRRMIPFTMILIVCGEFTPLIVPIFGAAITPATCRVPSQITKERDVASRRKYAALLAHASAAPSPSTEPASGSLPRPAAIGSDHELSLLAEFADPTWAVTADSAAVLRASAVFGLVKRHDRAAGSALAGLVYRPRLRRWVEYLAIDDNMIRNGGGVRALSAAEVRIACDERGACDVATFSKTREAAEQTERKWLERWLKLREGKTKSQ